MIYQPVAILDLAETGSLSSDGGCYELHQYVHSIGAIRDSERYFSVDTSIIGLRMTFLFLQENEVASDLDLLLFLLPVSSRTFIVVSSNDAWD